MKPRTKSFTLVELIVVCAILGVAGIVFYNILRNFSTDYNVHILRINFQQEADNIFLVLGKDVRNSTASGLEITDEHTVTLTYPDSLIDDLGESVTYSITAQGDFTRTVSGNSVVLNPGFPLDYDNSNFALGEGGGLLTTISFVQKGFKPNPVKFTLSREIFMRN